jgi:hypothetical protein
MKGRVHRIFKPRVSNQTYRNINCHGAEKIALTPALIKARPISNGSREKMVALWEL